MSKEIRYEFNPKDFNDFSDAINYMITKFKTENNFNDEFWCADFEVKRMHDNAELYCIEFKTL